MTYQGKHAGPRTHRRAGGHGLHKYGIGLVAGALLGVVGTAFGASSAPSPLPNPDHCATFKSIKSVVMCRDNRLEQKLDWLIANAGGPVVQPTPTPTPSPSSNPPPPSPTPTPTPPPPPPSPTPTPPPPPQSGYPNASNTGFTGTLTPYTGPAGLGNNVTISNALITQNLVVTGQNVTITNSEIAPTTDTAYVIEVKGSLTINNSTIIGQRGMTCLSTDPTSTNSVWRANQIDVSHCEDDVRPGNNSVLTNSYIHDQLGTASSHYDTCDTSTVHGNGWDIEHNTLINNYGQTSAAWLVGNGTFKNNFLAGGSYTLYAENGPLDIEGNVWSTMIHPKGGQYGPVYPTFPFTGTWANNTWYDGPNAGQAVAKP